jgi:hypothetical protein
MGDTREAITVATIAAILEDILEGTPRSIMEATLEMTPEVTITRGETREATLEVSIREVTQEAIVPVILTPTATDLGTEASLGWLLSPADVSLEVMELATRLGISLEEAQAQLSMQGTVWF